MLLHMSPRCKNVPQYPSRTFPDAPDSENAKSVDLACEFHGLISEPGAAKTLAWPGGVHAFLIGGPGGSGQSSVYKIRCLN